MSTSSLVVGSRLIHSGIYAHGRGVVADIRKDDSGAVRICLSSGRRIPVTMSVDVVFEDGTRQNALSDTAFAAPSHFRILDEAPADAAEIAGLIVKADEIAKAEREKREREAAAYSAEVERLRSSPEYAHLKQRPAGAFMPSRDISANVRAALKKAFPGVKFAVSLRGSQESINVAWTDGPLFDAVKAVLRPFETYAGLDVSGDYAEFSDAPFNSVFGGFKYIFPTREYSDAAVEKAIEKVWPRYDWNGRTAPSVAEYRRNGYHLVPDGFSHHSNLIKFVSDEMEESAA